jgi:hypothetical protein
MKPIFLPSTEANTKPIPGIEQSMIIVEPDSYKAGDNITRPFTIWVHGKDNLGAGTLSSLQTYWEGPYRGVPDTWKAAIDKYGMIGVAIQYGGSLLTYSQWLWVYNYVQSRYFLYGKAMTSGFSWGGGVIQKTYCTSVDFCNKNALVVQVAPTIEYNNGWTTVAKSSLVVWDVVNKGDTTTWPATAVNTVDAINNAGPITKATCTILDQNGHGGKEEAMGIVPMKGFIETAHELFLDILKNGPRMPKTGTVTPPIEPPTPTDPTTVKAVASYLGTGPIFQLDGRKSTGLKTGTIWPRWTLTKVPLGENLYAPLIKDSGSITASATFKIPGEYKIQFALLDNNRNVLSETELTLIYGTVVPAPVEKKPTNYLWDLKVLEFDDGSRENATCVFTTESGKEYKI